MIDTHAHIQDIEDVERAILDAKANGVDRIICVGYDIKSSIESIRLAESHDGIYAIIGIHPSEVDKIEDNYLDTLRELSKSNKVVAIGEIGLDYHYQPFDKDLQKRVFVEQIKLADELNLPICIHTRDSIGDTISILKENEEYLNHSGVLHCYSESIESFNIVKKYNFKISIGGVLTYRNARNVVDVVSKIPMEYIMLETDCPWLTPEPYRGKCKNEPKYVSEVLDKLAEIKGLTREEVEQITTNNAIELFKFKD